MNEKVKGLYKKANKCYLKKDYKLAIEYYNKVLDVDNNNFKALKELGESYENFNDKINAINCYEKIINIAPSNDIQTIIIYLNQIGLCYNSLRNYEVALSYFKKMEL